MTNRLNLHIAVTMVLMAMLSSCSATSLKSVWSSDTYKAESLKKVLIIGVDKYPDVRNLLEDEFARQLRESGTVAVPGHTIFKEDKILDRKTIVTKINELGIDSVIVTTVVSVKDAGTFQMSSYLNGTDFPVDVTTYNRYRFYEFYLACCEYVSAGRNLVIETKIFDAKYDSLIWAALSETVLDSASLEFSISSFAASVIRHLRGRKLLR
jgi:hypothetical protein